MPSFDLTLEPAFTPTLNLQGEGGTLVLELATILRGDQGPAYPSEAAQAATEAARDAALAAQGDAEAAKSASEAARDAAAASAASASGSAGTASAAAGSASTSATTASAAAGTATTKAAEAAASAGTATTKAAEATAAAAAASGAVSAALSAHTAASDPHPGYALESTIGQPNGLAPLDAGGKVAAAYLPSYVDDVIEVANFAALPATGETGKIYVTIDDGKTWRWGGSAYVEVSAGGANAAAVPFTPAGNLASTNVQAALQELDSEKLNLTGGTLTGLLTIAAGVITAFAPALSVAQTWNNAAVAFVGKTNDFTDTASAAGSLLERWTVGGSDLLSLRKDGKLLAATITSATSPAYAFTASSLAGWGWDSAGTNRGYAGMWAGIHAFSINGTGAGIASTLALQWTTNNDALGSPDLRLFRDAANTLAQRNGTAAQTLRLYNTYTDASNYERGFMRWASNVLEIGAEAAGTGTVRKLKLTTDVLVSGNSLDISGGALLTNSSWYMNMTALGWGVPYANRVILDTGLARNAAGVLEINTGTAGVYGDLILRALTATDTTLAGSGALAGSILNLAQTWNTTGTPTALKLNVTDTASNAAALLMDFQVNGVSRLRVGKNSYLYSTLSAFESAGWVTSGNTYGALEFGVASSVRWLVMKDRVASNGVPVCAEWGGHFELNADNAATNIVRLYRDGHGILAQRNGTNAQTFRLYNTYTDASNFERGFMRWASNVLEIGMEAAGTGTYRSVRVKAGNASLTLDGGSYALQLPGALLFNNATLHNLGGGQGLTLKNGSAVTGAALEMLEMTAPAAPAANGVRIYAEDNGAGKTRLMAVFATGAAVQIAIEP